MRLILAAALAGGIACASFYSDAEAKTDLSKHIPASCKADPSKLTDEKIAICRGIDLVKKLTPSSVTRLEYAENDNFDVELSRALRNWKNETGVVTVTIPTDALSKQDVELFKEVYPDTKRIMPWIDRIDETKGQVIICAINPSDRKLESFSLATAILQIFLDCLEVWVTYRPVKKYHARIVINPQKGEDRVPVERVEFIRRKRVDGELTCSWTASVEE